MRCLIDNKFLAGWHWNLAFKAKFKVGFIYGINLICASRSLSLNFSNQAPNDPDQIICIFSLVFKKIKS